MVAALVEGSRAFSEPVIPQVTLQCQERPGERMKDAGDGGAGMAASALSNEQPAAAGWS